jgi:hypothetical protein
MTTKKDWITRAITCGVILTIFSLGVSIDQGSKGGSFGMNLNAFLYSYLAGTLAMLFTLYMVWASEHTLIAKTSKPNSVGNKKAKELEFKSLWNFIIEDVLLEIICEFKKRIKLFLIPLVVSLFVFITTGSSDEAFSWLGALSMTIVVYIFYKLKQKVDETEG